MLFDVRDPAELETIFDLLLIFAWACYRYLSGLDYRTMELNITF